jgi:hypothetical protein
MIRIEKEGQMREIVIRLRLPERPKKSWLALAGAVILCVAGVVYALDYTAPFASGEALSSTKMNNYLKDLNSRVAAIESPPAYSAAGFGGNWSNWDAINASNVGFYKDGAGTVHLKGVVKENANNHSTIITLPSGYAPAKNTYFAIPCGTSNSGGTFTMAWLDVLSNGLINPESSCTTNYFVSLEGITWRAGQ